TSKISEKVGKEEKEEEQEKILEEVKEKEIENKKTLNELLQKEIKIEEESNEKELEIEKIREERIEAIEKEQKTIKKEKASLIESKEKELEAKELEIKEEVGKERKKEEEEKSKEEFEKKIEEKEYEKLEKESKKLISEEEKKMEKKTRFKILKLEKEIKESDINKLENDIKISLLQSDVALDVVNKIYDELKRELVGKVIKINEIEKVVLNSLRRIIFEILNQESINLEKLIEENKKLGKPTVILFLGFNGSGKTTTLAKLAYLLKKKGFSVVIAAADTFRAASIEQLEEHAKKLNIRMIKHRYGADAAAVVYDAIEHAKANSIDVILADTAGRSHANTNLMEELKKICRVNKPDLKILVLDALTGNDIVNQCESFNNAVGVDGMILTKVDVYDKGGAILSAAYTLKKPILFLGVGQGYEDLKVFNPEEVLDNLFKDIEQV
ncbi:MAG: signal recognition particle-docking protein FtsY, partial [Candidatus Aenigmatarchaeota archaeon]